MFEKESLMPEGLSKECRQPTPEEVYEKTRERLGIVKKLLSDARNLHVELQKSGFYDHRKFSSEIVGRLYLDTVNLEAHLVSLEKDIS